MRKIHFIYILVVMLLLSGITFFEESRMSKKIDDSKISELKLKSQIVSMKYEINRITGERNMAQEETRLASIIHRDLIPYPYKRYGNNLDYKGYLKFIRNEGESGKKYVKMAIDNMGRSKNTNLIENRFEDVVYAAETLNLETTFAKILAAGIAWTKNLPWHKATLKDTTITIGYEKDSLFECKVFTDSTLTNMNRLEKTILRNPKFYNKCLAIADSLGKRLVYSGWGLVLASYKTNVDTVTVPTN